MMGLFNDWLKGLVRLGSPQELMQAARDERAPREKGQEQKIQRRYSYDAGPMYYLGQQIVRAMQDAGYPARIFQCYRTPAKQAEYKAKGTSKAGPWESPHQFYEAVDIIHKSKAWNVSDDFWEALASCARIVGEKYGVDLVLGHDWGWDSAHIEIKDWRSFRRLMQQRWLDEYAEWNNGGKQGKRPEPRSPTAAELWQRFNDVLPAVAADYQRRKPGAAPVAPSGAPGGDR